MTVTDKYGMEWVAGGESTDDHLAYADHEAPILEFARGLLPRGGTFIDVGAHVGLYTLNMARWAGEVWAIEANPLTYATLMQNLKANAHRHYADIHSVNMAAWDSFGSLRLVDANDKVTGGSTRCEATDLEDPEQRVCRAAPLDDVLPPDCIPDLVKIDVEGAEAHVLRGLFNILESRNPPTLLIEMHDQIYDRPEVRTEVLDLIEDAGYAWIDNLTYSICYYVVAIHPRRRARERH